MIAVGPHPPSTAEHAIHGLGDANREPAHAARERTRIVRLDEKMDVVALNAEVQEAEALGARGTQRVSHGDEQALQSE